MHKYQSKQYIHKASHVEHRDTLHCIRQWVVLLGKREEWKACGISVKSTQTAQVSAPISGTWSVLNWDSASMAVVLSFHTSYS